MPVYEYRCRACGHEFDVQQAMTDDALTVCPECGGELRKVFSPVGIAFKGSGFYKNDSGSRSSKKATTSSGEGGSKGDGSTSSAGSGTDGGSSSSTAGTEKSGGSTTAPTSGSTTKD